VTGRATRGPWWSSRQRLEAKFNQHEPDFRASQFCQPVLDVDEYERSSLETIQVGVRFRYRDWRTGRPRVGYFDPMTGRFTAVDRHDRDIMTHFPTDVQYPELDYPYYLRDSNYS
jgi:hypothetical protein